MMVAKKNGSLICGSLLKFNWILRGYSPLRMTYDSKERSLEGNLGFPFTTYQNIPSRSKG